MSTGVSAVTSVAAVAGSPAMSAEERVYEVVVKQAALVREQRPLDLRRAKSVDDVINGDLLNEAYDRCGEVCAEYAKTFYLGTFFSS